MIKLVFLLITMFVFTACGNTKVINGNDHSFVSYVILNKGSSYNGGLFTEQPPENFPIIRLLKWNEEE